MYAFVSSNPTYLKVYDIIYYIIIVTTNTSELFNLSQEIFNTYISLPRFSYVFTILLNKYRIYKICYELYKIKSTFLVPYL